MSNKFYEDLEAKRQEATVDKAELFDFYNGYWDSLVNKAKRLEEEVDYLEQYIDERTRIDSA